MKNKTSLLLIPLILSIGIIPFIPNSYSQTMTLEECREGYLIVHVINGNTLTCFSIERAERFAELGIIEIVDPSYNSEPEAPESIIETDPVIEPEPEPVIEFSEPVIVEQESSTDTQPLIPALEVAASDTPSPGNSGQSGNPDPPGRPDNPGRDGIRAEGYVVIEVFDFNGNKKFHREDHNLVVDNGLETLADLAFGTTHSTGESLGGFTWISVGTGGTAPAAGNTDCETQHGSKKQDASVTNTALGAIINVSWVAELGAGTIQEICLTDDGAAATGNLFARQTYTGIPITASDTVNAEWTITFADSNGT